VASLGGGWSSALGKKGRKEGALTGRGPFIGAGAEVGGAKFVKYTFPPSIAKRFTKLCMGVD
jgi:hypothetical protein